MSRNHLELENPIRGEYYSAERLEEYARILAGELKVSDTPQMTQSLLPRMRENGEKLFACYRDLAEAINEKEALSPGAEWLVDNFHIIEEQLREIRLDLPPQYYRELPKLEQGELAGYPRIYALALALVAHTDSRLEADTIRRFVQSYQKITPLGIGELWALAITLRLVLVENLRRFAVRLTWDRDKRSQADIFADQLIEAPADHAKFHSLLAQLPEVCGHSIQIGCAFIAQLAKRLRDLSPEHWPAFEALEKHLSHQNSTTEHAVHVDHQTQASNQVSIANIITSMRLLSSLNWQEFFESVSLVDRTLEKDPQGCYAQMTFATRDQYRHVVEKISKRTGRSEIEVAEMAVALARQSHGKNALDQRRAHVGYYLVDKGLAATENALPALVRRVSLPAMRDVFSKLYFPLLGLFFVGLMALPLRYGWSNGFLPSDLLALALLLTLPLSDLAVGFMNFLVTNLVSPRQLPKLDFSFGIPEQGRTAVVIPCMLAGSKVIHELIQKLEIHYLGNADPKLIFGLLTDYTDAATQTLPGDQFLIQSAIDGIADLNRKYAKPGSGDIFFLLNRKRLWNQGEKTWMGWERKRGKLHEFNKFARGAMDTSFEVVTAPQEMFRQIRYVITLDADSQLPRDAASKLIGAILHPLNQPYFDAKVGRVTEGYGILQPRISIALESSAKSHFARVFSGYSGIDPYTTAVSDVYQDLFAEGSYTGKGLYDIDAFEAALKDRVPENTVLSHDLYEGIFARVALVSDVELYDDYPQSYSTFFRRQHRWIRGDWQIARWILPWVPNAKGEMVRSRLPFVARWKILDNLRRSLVAPSLLTMLLLGCTVLPGSSLYWLATGFAIILFPSLTSICGSWLNRSRSRERNVISTPIEELLNPVLQASLYLIFLAHQSYVALDAIIRVTYRANVSHTKLMEWSTASQEESKGHKAKLPFWQTIWPTEIASVAVVLGIALWDATSFLFAGPLLFLWMCYPLVAKFLNRKVKRTQLPLKTEDRKLMRLLARFTWNFFDTFVTETDNSLPPDNYQIDPKPIVAHRTSPTNIGIYLLSLIAARDFGYVTSADFMARLKLTLASMLKMEKFNGHFLNWYDTLTLAPLYPKYVSTVDSGNLAGYLITTKQACMELPNAAVVDRELLAGFRDTLAIALAELKTNSKLTPAIDRVTQCEDQLLSMPLATRASDWGKRLQDLLDCLEDLRAVLSTEVSELPDAESGRSSYYWMDLAISHVQGALKDLITFAPWARVGFSIPDSELAHRVIVRLDSLGTFAQLAGQYQIALNELDGFDDANGMGALLSSLRDGQRATEQLLLDADGAIQTLQKLFTEMNFTFLLDKERNIFSIGYNPTEGKHDRAVYDLLASESRLASFTAIAKGDVPQKHWFQLGRQLVPTNTGRSLISWTASMFEYLMPLLVMRSYEHTLLDETYQTVLLRQMSYGAEQGVPWGISEAGYNARDLQLNYQYGPFGIPGLGLKRGLIHDLVVSPYSTLLGAMVQPTSVISNLKRLIKLGALADYGFYEAIDYTAERLPKNQKFAFIKSFMAHHQGMSLVAIDNVLHRNIMQNRFHAEPCVKATRLLLQEQIPRGVPPLVPKAAQVELESDHRPTFKVQTRQYSDPNTNTPRVQLLSNGTYTVMVSSAGGGYSKCGNQAVTRWSEDPTRDNWGSFIYVKDVSQKRIWSSTFQPTTQSVPDDYHVTFAEDKVEFRRRDGDISSLTEILVAPEDNVEIRFLTLLNQSGETRTLEITSYLEPVLATRAADIDHMAFSKLFIQTEFLASRNALLAQRRKRSSHEAESWALHTVVCNQTLSGRIQYETDRSRFIGRGHSTRNPAAVFDGVDLTDSTGATLDPIFSLRVQVELRPGESVQLSFTTGVADSRAQAVDLADRYHDIHSFERESKLAWTKSRVDLRHLNIDPDTAYLFQRLAEKILYSDASLRPPAADLKLHTKAQLLLWQYGISGDLPIATISVSESKDLPMIRKLLRCHEYLRLKGLSFDLVIFNEHGPTYMQGLQDEILQQILTTGSQSWLNKPGGVFLLRGDFTPADQRSFLRAVSRVCLVADRPLKEQIAKKSVEKGEMVLLPLPSKRAGENIQNLPIPELRNFNGYGGFSPDGKRYTIVLDQGRWTPAPWINVIGNGAGFGFQVSEAGAGMTWSVNSQANRLTPWSNDPVSDPPGEIIYLRDEESREYWTPTPLPIREKSNYLVHHGLGYSTFEHISRGIQTELTMFVPVGESIKISILKLKNLNGKKRRISLTNFTEWNLGTGRYKSAPHLICEIDSQSSLLVAQNPYDSDFAGRVAFADLSELDRTFTCCRKEFLGRNGSTTEPLALRRRGLSQRNGTGVDPCAVLQTVLDLDGHEEREIVITLGQTESLKHARDLALRYRDVETAKRSLDEVVSRWNKQLSTIQVRTPEPSFDIMVNGWLLYQTLSCRFWSRTAFYQSGGAFGFRDQLQDCMAFVYSDPSLTREQILRAAGRQFREGDVQHWWHPPTGRGVRTRMSDDLLWLPYVVSFYISKTGDRSILEEKVALLDAPLLTPEQEDCYATPLVSTESVTVFEHCTRAINRSLTIGSHGLPLIGTGDWNDGMNRVGVQGQGESVWLGWFLYRVIRDFVPYCDAPENGGLRELYLKHAQDLKVAIEDHGWDGNWYRRAFFDDGTPLGSALNSECQIDSIAQTWSVLSGAGDPSRSAQAMKSLDAKLVCRDSRLILLLSPPFDRGALDPGYIKGYVPGVRENGGQYTHAAIWAIMAQAEMGDGTKAMEFFNMINPIHHGRDQAASNRYKLEPYVLAGDVYSQGAHQGRGGWSWYTGSSAWFYRSGVESILGFQLMDKKLKINPCIPNKWKGFEIDYLFKNTMYKIKVDNPRGLNRGAAQISIDGLVLDKPEIDLVDDGKTHDVVVTMIDRPSTVLREPIPINRHVMSK